MQTDMTLSSVLTTYDLARYLAQYINDVPSLSIRELNDIQVADWWLGELADIIKKANDLTKND